MKLTSTPFSEGGMIPKHYAYKDKNLSPPLAWSDVPPGTQSFALICDDPDAPRKDPWVHWVLFNVPGDVKELAEGASRSAKLPAGDSEGKNDFGKIGYGGTMPPTCQPTWISFMPYMVGYLS